LGQVAGVTPMRARRDESIWSTDAAAGYCRAVRPIRRAGALFRIWRWFWAAF
jgi:hypothetical protein